MQNIVSIRHTGPRASTTKLKIQNKEYLNDMYNRIVDFIRCGSPASNGDVYMNYLYIEDEFIGYLRFNFPENEVRLKLYDGGCENTKGYHAAIGEDPNSTALVFKIGEDPSQVLIKYFYVWLLDVSAASVEEVCDGFKLADSTIKFEEVTPADIYSIHLLTKDSMSDQEPHCIKVIDRYGDVRAIYRINEDGSGDIWSCIKQERKVVGVQYGEELVSPGYYRKVFEWMRAPDDVDYSRSVRYLRDIVTRTATTSHVKIFPSPVVLPRPVM